MINRTRVRTAAWLVILLGAGAFVASAQEPAGIRVTEYGVGSGVKDRALVGRADGFAEGTQVWFWTRVLGGNAGDRIRHVWIRDGKEISIGLTIGGTHWRTWSNKTLHPGSAGQWAVEARDEQDRVLARQEFVCTAGPAGETEDGGAQ